MALERSGVQLLRPEIPAACPPPAQRGRVALQKNCRRTRNEQERGSGGERTEQGAPLRTTISRSSGQRSGLKCEKPMV